VGEKCYDKFLLEFGTDGFSSPPKEGVLRIFSPLKIRRLRPGLNPRTWVPKASTPPLDHRRLYTYMILRWKVLQGICLIAQQCVWYGERSKGIKVCRLELPDCPPFCFWLVGWLVGWWFVGGWLHTTCVTACKLALLLERTDVSTLNKPHAVFALWE
jgi:hypothetical protein